MASGPFMRFPMKPERGDSLPRIDSASIVSPRLTRPLSVEGRHKINSGDLNEQSRVEV